MNNTSPREYIWVVLLGVVALVAVWVAWRVGITVGRDQARVDYEVHIAQLENQSSSGNRDEYSWSIRSFSDIEGYQDLRNFQKGDALEDMSDWMGHGPGLGAHISDDILVHSYLAPYDEISQRFGLRYQIYGYASTDIFSGGTFSVYVYKVDENGQKERYASQKFLAHADGNSNDAITGWVAYPQERELEIGMYSMDFITYEGDSRKTVGSLPFSVVE